VVKATVSNSTRDFDLKSCVGGKVTLKRMTYGQKLERVELATQSVLKTETDRRGRPTSGGAAEMDIKMMQRVVAEYEFSRCVVDHNLEDETGKKLNFKNPEVLDVLDPRIGDEISEYITEMNNFEEEEGKGN
jgi:hypothetical protein